MLLHLPHTALAKMLITLSILYLRCQKNRAAVSDGVSLLSILYLRCPRGSARGWEAAFPAFNSLFEMLRGMNMETWRQRCTFQFSI